MKFPVGILQRETPFGKRVDYVSCQWRLFCPPAYWKKLQGHKKFLSEKLGDQNYLDRNKTCSKEWLLMNAIKADYKLVKHQRDHFYSIIEKKFLFEI